MSWKYETVFLWLYFGKQVDIGVNGDYECMFYWNSKTQFVVFLHIKSHIGGMGLEGQGQS